MRRIIVPVLFKFDRATKKREHDKPFTNYNYMNAAPAQFGRSSVGGTIPTS